MVFAALLVVILFITLISVLPARSHSERWGYLPSSGIGLALIVVVVLMLKRAL